MAGFKNPITVLEAIKEIQANNYLLPAFQREFTWNAVQVERLFDSLMKGYPINSMMFWRVRGAAKQKYKFYRILESFRERHKTHNEVFDPKLKDTFMAIIDGQQRLTSLYIGLCGSYAYHRHYARYDDTEWNFPTRHLYLNLSRMVPEEEDDKTYNFLFIDKAITTDVLYSDKEGDKWIRVGHVLTFGEDYDAHDFAEEHGLNRDERKMLSKLHEVITKSEVINYYEEDTEDPDKAVNIFVRINSGGTRLSFADILLSIAVAAWQQDAREEIHRLVDAVNAKGFSITHDYVLKAFLYLFHSDVKFRIGSFDNDFIGKVEKNWSDIRDAILEMFSLLRYYGLNGQTLTSNYATLPILHYMYKRGIWQNFTASISLADDRSAIKRWLMKTLLLQSFGYRSDGSLRRSRKVLQEKEWMAFPATDIERELGQTVSDEAFYDTVLSYQKDNRLAFVVLSLLYQGTTFDGFGYHLDHLHPAATWKKEIGEWNMYNSVLNLQLLSERENESKGAKPLELWVEEKTRSVSREAFLESHLIPDTDLSLECFAEFIEARKKLMIERLKMVL